MIPNLKLFIAILLIGFLELVSPTSAHEQSDCDVQTQITKGREFLLTLVDPQLDLLPEFKGHSVVWLYHDNYLAAKVLASSNPEIASRIFQAMKRYGVDQSGKIEILFGKSELPIRHYELREVAKNGSVTIKSEFTTDKPNQDFESYADLLLFSAIGEKNESLAIQHWKKAISMWDGVGFIDKASKKSEIYATYKLALALIASRQLKQNTVDDSKDLLEISRRLRSMQDNSGGWITDYRPDGTPIGFANVETTCLAILALEAQQTFETKE